MKKFEHSHHDHGHHEHEHSHSHDTDNSKVEKNDEDKLAILLVHWIEHNKTHQESFEQWAQKAQGMDKTNTAEYIKKAVEYMERANEMLMEARKSM